MIQRALVAESVFTISVVDMDMHLQDYGHRVRLATHANFKEFVLTAGLEFFPLGGDPKVLAECTYLHAYY